MRITERQLRHVIRQVLKEEATANDIYGKVMFGKERGLGEPNTSQEDAMADAFKDTFFSDMRSLRPIDIQNLVKLRDEGKYTDILQVPAYVKRAWRVIEINPSNEKFFAGLDPYKDDFSKPRLFEQNLSMPLFKYAVNSWTISPQSLRELSKEVVGSGQFQVILSVDLSSQRDAFILNPGNLQPLSQEFFWQAEIWQVAPVVCDKWTVAFIGTGKYELANAVDLVV